MSWVLIPVNPPVAGWLTAGALGPQVSSADLGIEVGLASAALATTTATATLGVELALAPVVPPSDVAATIVDYATLGPVVGASGGSTGNHLIYAQNSGRWWFFTYGTVLNSGTATGAGQSTSQLVDTSKSFTASTYRGATCLILTGTGAGQAFEIGANTATALTVQNNGVGGTIQTAPVAGSSTYVIIESRRVRAYVSSSSDLSTATWAAATNGVSAAFQNQTGFDVSAGRNDGGGFGDYPGDARLLAMGYESIGGVDVVLANAQQNLHWFKITLRGKLGPVSAATMAWDSPGATNTNPWDDGFPGNECAPTLLQGQCAAASTTGRWHAGGHQNTVGQVIYVHDATDNGTGTTSSLSLDWGGTRATFDTNSDGTNFPWSAALAPLASGIMLEVHALGNTGSAALGFGNVSTQTGLRWVKSTSATAWPTTNVAATISGLASTANDPNDWGMVARTTTDVHVVRRNSATVLEHVRFNGTSWGSVASLPTTGLTGHVAASGVGLATDGTTVWCVVLDSDASNSIRYLTWDATNGWASSWSTLATNPNTKAFIAVHRQLGNNQIGVAWTEGPDGSGRYTVRAAAIPSVVTQTGTATLGIQAALAPAGLGIAPVTSTLGVQAAMVPAAIGVTTVTATPGVQAALAPVGLRVVPATSTPGVQAALAPSALGLAQASSALAITAALAAVGIGVAPATATLGVTAALASAGLGLAPATSAPGITATLAPTGLGIAPAASTPGVQAALAPAGIDIAPATSTPGIAATLAPAATATTTATAAPGVSVGLAPSAGGIQFATTSPGIQAALASAAIGVTSVTSTLGIQAALSGVGLGIAPATAAPGVAVGLAPSAGGQQFATATPGIQAALTPTGLGIAPVAATPAVQVGLAPVALGITTVTGTPGVQAALSGAAVAQRLVTASQGVQVALLASADRLQLASTTPGIQAALGGSALRVVPVTAAPIVQVALAPSSVATAPATASPGVTLALLGSAGGIQIATVTLGVAVALTATAIPARPASGTAGVTVALVAASLVIAPSQASPTVTVALVPSAVLVGRAQAAPGVTIAFVAAAVVGTTTTAAPGIQITIIASTAPLAVAASGGDARYSTATATDAGYGSADGSVALVGGATGSDREG